MLTFLRVVHTVVWALFVACIVGIFVCAHSKWFGAAAVLIAIIAAEAVVLFLNKMRCPLTVVAARYTDDRAENFDIYLPRWLARHNQTIFGALYAVGVAYTLIKWLH